MSNYEPHALNTTGTASGTAARAAWLGVAAIVIMVTAAMTFLSTGFGYDREVIDMPALALAGGLVAVGLVFAAIIPFLMTKTVGVAPRDARALLAIMIVAGFVGRLILFASEPMLEDDYQRYLWDGAVTAAGGNPYDASPAQAQNAGPETLLGQLKSNAGVVLLRVNHPELTTIYPPIAQGVFAIAHIIKPWNLTAWRSLLLVCDVGILALLLALLKEAGRAPLWAAIYWLNPLVLKEAFNSAHMEPLVLAPVLLALWLAARRRYMLAIVALALATGVKLWPALLLPLIVRPLLVSRQTLITALALFALIILVLLVPFLQSGFSETSGLRAYAENWKTNSALFPLIESFAARALVPFGLSTVHAALAVKAALATAVASFALFQARPPISDARDLMQRAGMIVAALVLLSPAQYPWYLLWLIPFLAFWPSPAFLLLSATIAIYYASFHFAARDTLETAGPLIVAAIWVPVWVLAAREAWQWRRAAASESRA